MRVKSLAVIREAAIRATLGRIRSKAPESYRVICEFYQRTL